MTTSGTYQWNPPLYDLVINAYGRIGVRRAILTIDHWADAAMACNLLQAEWSNRQVNLWTVDLQSIPLVEGKATYDVDPTTLMIMTVYLETVDGAGRPIDEMLNPVDRDAYAAYPDKQARGEPSVYWFNQQIQPTLTVWEVPDSATANVSGGTLKFYRARRIQDAVVPGGLNPEVPYQFLKAYVLGLAVELAQLYAPARWQEMMLAYGAAWK
jgi:hypothetical protein